MGTGDTRRPADGLDFDALTVLYQIARVLASGGPLDNVLSQVLEVLANRAGMARGMVSIVNPLSDEVTVDVAHGLSESARRKGRYRPGEGITGRVVATGRPVAVPRLSEEPLFLDRTGARHRLQLDALAFLCVPIRAGDAVVGALSADRLGLSGHYSLDEQLRFLEAVGDLIAQTVHARRREEERRALLEAENARLRAALSEHERPTAMIGNSRPMREVFRLIAHVTGSDTTVLIRGETGTGKELVARAIHQQSPRRSGPFIVVNCAALPEPLLESEIFGHERGAFTGAVQRRIGRFEAAEHGTIFLDEAGELPPSAQVRLLRVIQEREFMRVGGERTVKVDVRIVCATNRDLEADVQARRFREDLYYRLNVFPIHLPPLRDRGADVLLLADHFVRKYAARSDTSVNRIANEAIDMLARYPWPGNVRELGNCIERAVLLATDGVIHAYNLPPSVQSADRIHDTAPAGTLAERVAACECELLVQALRDADGNQTKAAELLGTTKRVVNYKVHKYGIDCSQLRG